MDSSRDFFKIGSMETMDTISPAQEAALEIALAKDLANQVLGTAARLHPAQARRVAAMAAELIKEVAENG